MLELRYPPQCILCSDGTQSRLTIGVNNTRLLRFVAVEDLSRHGLIVSFERSRFGETGIGTAVMVRNIIIL